MNSGHTEYMFTNSRQEYTEIISALQQATFLLHFPVRSYFNNDARTKFRNTTCFNSIYRKEKREERRRYLTFFRWEK